MHNYRPHPYIAIPHDPHPNAEVDRSYPPGLLDPWDATTPTARQPTNRLGTLRTRTRSAVDLIPPNLNLQVPEAQIHRSVSARQTAHEYYHRSSQSDSELSFAGEYSGGRSTLTSPFSPSVNLPADEVGISCAGVITSSLISVRLQMELRLGLLTRELSNMTYVAWPGLAGK